VACRRLVTWLDLGGRRIGRDDLRWLRRGVGPIRDLDVQLSKEGPPGMVEWLRMRWTEERPVLLELLDDPRTDGILTMFRTMRPIDRKEAKHGLATLVVRAAKAVRAVDSPDPEALHRVRRRLRPIRYALEWLGRGAKPIVEVQDSLGELGDLVVTHRLTVAWGGDPDRAAFLEEELARVARATIPLLPGIQAVLEDLS
jgi:CHAD domain-containing protein